MKPRERVEIALRGLKPDRVPIVPIYDSGYVMTSREKDLREFIVASSSQRVQYIEESFLRHEVDGFFVHLGTSDEWSNEHTVERRPDYWLVTSKKTGQTHRLLPDGSTADRDGTPVLKTPSAGGKSQIQSFSDLDRLVPVRKGMTEDDYSERLAPLRHLCQKYPDHHFSFQTSTPMVKALSCCGGYVEGLITLASNRELFRALLARCVDSVMARIAPGRSAGAHSTWFTSYYTGADTISPKDYAELVFPYELQVCQAAKDQGLFVLNWFLGDLMPVLDKVMELPIDALVLEQGRKGYEIDPVAIRKRVGSRFCLFGFAYERDFCEYNRESLRRELIRQIAGAGQDGAFVAGTPIVTSDAKPAAVEFYFQEVHRLGRYRTGEPWPLSYSTA